MIPPIADKVHCAQAQLGEVRQACAEIRTTIANATDAELTVLLAEIKFSIAALTQPDAARSETARTASALVDARLLVESAQRFRAKETER